VKQKGYATACIGKMASRRKPEFLRPARLRRVLWPALQQRHEGGRKYKDGVMPPLPLYRAKKSSKQPDQSQLTRRYTEEAINSSARAGRPFFLYFRHTMVIDRWPLAGFKGRSPMG